MRLIATFLVLLIGASVTSQEEIKHHRFSIDLPSLGFTNIYVNYGYQFDNKDVISVGYHYLNNFYDESFYHYGTALQQDFIPGVSGEIMYQYKLDREENVQFKSDAYLNFVIGYDQYRMINSWERWDIYETNSYYNYNYTNSLKTRLKFAFELCYNWSLGESPWFIEGSLGTGLLIKKTSEDIERRDLRIDTATPTNNYDETVQYTNGYRDNTLPISGGIAIGIKL